MTMQVKTCNVCYIEKNISEFYKAGNKTYKARCKDCYNKSIREKNLKNKNIKIINYASQLNNIEKRISIDKIKHDDVHKICEILELVLSLYGCDIINNELFNSIGIKTNDFVKKINSRLHISKSALLDVYSYGSKKECPRCGKVKEFTSFRKTRIKNNGEVCRGRICKECIATQQRIKYKQHPNLEKHRLATKKHYWNNVEKIREKRRKKPKKNSLIESTKNANINSYID